MHFDPPWSKIIIVIVLSGWELSYTEMGMGILNPIQVTITNSNTSGLSLKTKCDSYIPFCSHPNKQKSETNLSVIFFIVIYISFLNIDNLTTSILSAITILSNPHNRQVKD